MTTILSTPEFIMADRSLSTHEFEVKTDYQKLHLSKNKKAAIAIGGCVGFETSKDVIQEFITGLDVITDGSLDKAFDANKDTRNILSKHRQYYLDKIKANVGAGGIMILQTANYRYYFNGDCETSPKVLYPNACAEYGSGGNIALTLYTLGYSAEEIARIVPELDEYSSNKFDIIYTKDIAL